MRPSGSAAEANRAEPYASDSVIEPLHNVGHPWPPRTSFPSEPLLRATARGRFNAKRSGYHSVSDEIRDKSGQQANHSRMILVVSSNLGGACMAYSVRLHYTNDKELQA